MTFASTSSCRDSLIQIYSDVYKDAYGYRPRGIDYNSMTLEELEADFARFEAICKENAQFEAEAGVIAVHAFKSNIAKMIAIGASDEEAALRWMAAAAFETYGWDYEHYLYNAGILHTEYGKELARKFAPIFDKLGAASYVAQK